MICEKCNSEMIPFKDGLSQGWSCKCGWGIVTSCVSEIDSDCNKYSIILKAVTSPDVNSIKTISNSLGCNFLEAKNLLKKGEKIIEDKAPVIKDKALELKNNNILYTIIPNFPYSIEK